MPLTKQEKQSIIEELKAVLPTSKAVILANYAGSTVKELTELRDQLAQKELKFTVTKNTLLKKVLTDLNFNIADSILDQPVGLTIDQKDEVQPAKLIYYFSKSHENLKVLGAIVNGAWVEASIVAQLAQLPSREQLLAQVVGTIAAPLSGVVNVLAGNLRGLVSVLSQYNELRVKS